jgi:hypothetical protein
MSKLPPPSDTPRVFMNVGTLSGLDVLRFGTVAPGATVELKNGSVGHVISVKGRRLTLHGVIPGSTEIRLDDGSIVTASNGDIATVLHEAPPPAVAAPDAEPAPVSGSGAARPVGV